MKDIVVKYLTNQDYDKWNSFVDVSPQGNIFNKTYWLDSVCEEFKILVCEENRKIVGGIALTPMYKKYYRNPKLTPQLGVLLSIHESKVKYSTGISKDIEITGLLVDKLKDFNIFDYNFSYNFTNFLPFIWEGFNVGVHYTYVIEDLSDTEAAYNNFQYDVKYLIKKAIKNDITVVDNLGIKDFYEINQKTFKRQKIEMPYSIEFLIKLDEVLAKHNNRKMFFAKDSSGKIIAGVYLLYDKSCTYYLMGGADPDYRNTGCQTLLLWESIKFASSVSEKFDFEGSMVKNIERSFREFGGKQKIIYNVYKGKLITKLVFSFASKNKNIIRKFLKV